MQKYCEKLRSVAIDIKVSDRLARKSLFFPNEEAETWKNSRKSIEAVCEEHCGSKENYIFKDTCPVKDYILRET